MIKMDNIFIVTESWFDYERSSQCVLLATFDKIIADQKVKEMQQRQVKAVENSKAIQKHLLLWKIENPQPVYKEPKEKTLPYYGPKRNKWSPEQLAEYSAVKQSNIQLKENAIRPRTEWSQKFTDEQRRFVSSFPEVEQKDINDQIYSYYLSWEIETIPFYPGNEPTANLNLALD